MAWGHVDFGGDSNTVQAWDTPHYGGDAGTVQGQLKNVQQIQATRAAFAAILRVGSIVTCGEAGAGGDSSAVQGQLEDL